tara:strand:- start:566 stop:877 length:312 start_codon:yes stop_codon:yes gene_type:complete
MKKQISKKVLDVQKIAKLSIPILKKNGVIKAGIFGSYARGDAKQKSDIDMLIKFKGSTKSLLDLIKLEDELKQNLNKEVDVITYRSINKLIKKNILNEEVRIL